MAVRVDSDQRFQTVGVRYCVQHHGIANEDDDECDFKGRGRGAYGLEPFPCNFRELGYLKAKR